MTRTIESSINELQELKNQASEISDFLKGKELSSTEYKKEYEDIEKKLNDIRAKVNEIVIFFNREREKGDVSIQQANAIQALLPSFRELKTSFDGLIKPSDFDKKLEELKPIDLGNLSPRSGFDDIELDMEEFVQLKPERLLARTSNGIEYYQITYKNQTTILRYNSNDPGDEVALYVNVYLDLKNADKNSIGNLIKRAESNSNGFQDVEINGTASVRNIGVMASGTIAGVTAGVGALKSSAAIGGTITGLSRIPLAAKLPIGMLSKISSLGKGVAAIASVKGAVVIGAGVIIGGVAASMTDLDYTSEDYKNDFGSDLEKCRLETLRTNYR